MAKKKNNTKRNLAIGASTLLAGALALKSGGLKKAYNSISRVGKKRGKYKTNSSSSTVINSNQATKLVPENNPTILTSTIPKALPPSRIPNSLKNNNPQTITKKILDPIVSKKLQNSVKIKQRKEKLKYNRFDTTYLQSAASKVRSSTDQLKVIKNNPERANVGGNFVPGELRTDAHKEMLARQASTAYKSRRFNLLTKAKKDGRVLRKEVDRLRALGEYSKQLYLLSEFSTI